MTDEHSSGVEPIAQGQSVLNQSDQDQTAQILDRVQRALKAKTTLQIVAGRSHAFLGNPVLASEDLSVAGHRGVIEYHPEELVIRVRAGTPVAEVAQLLALNHQYLPFEPPVFNSAATIGGVVATGLSGPGRPFRGSVRDHLLGVTLISGNAERLSFGGQVMKNVAGYDASRLMAGSFGTLGVILDVSMKVLPQPEAESTLVQRVDVQQAQQLMLKALKIPETTAAAWHDGQLYLRYSGAQVAMDRICNQGPGQVVETDIWRKISQLNLPDCESAKCLWRVTTAPSSSVLLSEACLVDWAGGQRWVVGDGHNIRDMTGEGEAQLFRGPDALKESIGCFHPLRGVPARLNERLRQTFDPASIFNPGVLFPLISMLSARVSWVDCPPV